MGFFVGGCGGVVCSKLVLGECCVEVIVFFIFVGICWLGCILDVVCMGDRVVLVFIWSKFMYEVFVGSCFFGLGFYVYFVE